MRGIVAMFSSLLFATSFSSALAIHNSPASLKARVSAVGKLQIDKVRTDDADDAGDSDTGEDGETIYNRTCAVCHNSGVAGSPVLGKASDWSERIEQGIDTLTAHAIQGFSGATGVMPAKGGNVSLSDNAVTAAVQYMVDQAE